MSFTVDVHDIIYRSLRSISQQIGSAPQENCLISYDTGVLTLEIDHP